LGFCGLVRSLYQSGVKKLLGFEGMILPAGSVTDPQGAITVIDAFAAVVRRDSKSGSYGFRLACKS